MALDLSMFNRFAVNFQAGDIIFCEHEPGDNFYLIQSGRVQIVKIIDDLEKIIDILQPGEIFGEMAILEEAPRSASAVALDTVRENFEILMKGTPAIALKLLKLFTKRIYDQKRRFLILTLDDPQAKIADVFLMLAETQTGNDESVNQRVFMTSVEDIAHWAGVSPVMSKKILNQFASQRRLEIFPDKIVVQNINDFARFVSSKRRSQVSE